MPRKLTMGESSRIGHLNIVKGLDSLILGEHATIGNLNWVTGFPLALSESGHFSHKPNRNPSLIVNRHAAVTNRHLIDCTDEVTIGNHATLAGFRSQILTHSIKLDKSIQDCAPVFIGSYSFVGTGCILLPGAALPCNSVLGAGSVLNKRFVDEYMLYSGNPAIPAKALDRNLKYFTRTKGRVI